MVQPTVDVIDEQHTLRSRDQPTGQDEEARCPISEVAHRHALRGGSQLHVKDVPDERDAFDVGFDGLHGLDDRDFFGGQDDAFPQSWQAHRRQVNDLVA